MKETARADTIPAKQRHELESRAGRASVVRRLDRNGESVGVKSFLQFGDVDRNKHDKGGNVASGVLDPEPRPEPVRAAPDPGQFRARKTVATEGHAEDELVSINVYSGQGPRPPIAPPPAPAHVAPARLTVNGVGRRLHIQRRPGSVTVATQPRGTFRPGNILQMLMARPRRAIRNSG
jgi:hypothetical protein